jgi:hypothetical protein
MMRISFRHCPQSLITRNDISNQRQPGGKINLNSVNSSGLGIMPYILVSFT